MKFYRILTCQLNGSAFAQLFPIIIFLIFTIFQTAKGKQELLAPLSK